MLAVLRTSESRRVVRDFLTTLTKGQVPRPIVSYLADTTVDALVDAVKERTLTPACNAEAPQGGDRGARLCVREPHEGGRHRYKEPPHGKRWALPGPVAVSDRGRR